MPIISTTMCYPNPVAPTQGIFIRRRLKAIHRLMPVKVVAPVPWFPILAGTRFDPLCGIEDVPPVWYPRMSYLPGLLKPYDSRFYARALARGLLLCGQSGERPARSIHTLPDKGLEKAQLIEAHFVWPDGVGAWHVAQERGKPFVCTIRGKLVSQIVDRRKRDQIRRMLRGADALVAVSRSLADLACEVAGVRLDVRVIPNGVDERLFHRMTSDADTDGPSVEARALCRWSCDARYVVSVGHLQGLKGFDRLIEVWPAVRQRMGDARLMLVGGDAGEPGYVRRLHRLIETSGLGAGGSHADAVTLVGRVEPRRVAVMLNAADLFVLASRSEGCCNAIAEALACGCPVVATDVGGNSEMINDPALGRLVPSGDREALLEGICGALSQDWDREAISAVGRRRDWQQVAAECVDVFKAVLHRRG